MMPRWALAVPILAAAILAAALTMPVEPWLSALCGAALIAAVLGAVHHAEVVALRVGEPLGTLVLTLAITVIEVALIVSVMLTGGESNSSLARDTVYSVIMIICNGVVGLCLVVGGLHHREQMFRIEGAASALVCIIALSTLTLVLPAFTTSAPGLMYTEAQLAFAAVASLALWGVFVFVQTVRHRDYFLPAGDASQEERHASPPPLPLAWASFGLLIVCLVAVVGLAKSLSPTVEHAVAAVGAPIAVIGIIIAMLVLMPETWAALRAARANRLQTSLNLALGSAVASIGLSIPAVAAVSILFHMPLVLGLGAKDLVLLLLTFMVGTITLATGRTNVLQGAVHMVLFAAFVFLAFAP